MFNKAINNIIISELRLVLSSIPENERTVEALIKKFSVHLNVDEETTSQPSSSKSNKKKPRQKKIIVAENRCIALKKDQTQCNGKRSPNNDKDLCPLHMRVGSKFGVIVSSIEEDNLEEDNLEEDNLEEDNLEEDSIVDDDSNFEDHEISHYQEDSNIESEFGDDSDFN